MLEPLRHEPLYPRLAWQWRWRGIGLAHLAAGPSVAMGLWPCIWLVQESIWPDCPWSWSLVVGLAVASFVCVLQYRKDADFMPRQLRGLRLPKHLSPLVQARGEQSFSTDVGQTR